MEHVFNIVSGRKMGMTFSVCIQDKGVNALLDTGAEKSCMSIDMFAKLKLSINAGKTPKLRNASGKDMKLSSKWEIPYLYRILYSVKTW